MSATPKHPISPDVRGAHSLDRLVGPPRGLVQLVWRCRCHGWAYCHPSCCLHTEESNLIPPEIPIRPNAPAQRPRPTERTYENT